MPKKRRKLKSFVYLLHNKRGTTKNTTFFNLNHFLIAIKRKNPFDVISRGFLYSLLKIISGASLNKYSPIIYDFGVWWSIIV